MAWNHITSSEYGNRPRWRPSGSRGGGLGRGGGLLARSGSVEVWLLLWLAASWGMSCGEPGRGLDAGRGDAGLDLGADLDSAADASDLHGDAVADVSDLGGGDDSGPGWPDLGAPGFDDHTVTGFDSEAAMRAYLAPGPEPRQFKFVITGFGSGDEVPRYMDGGFYGLHDEWYWFRLANGVRVPGEDQVDPLEGLSFSTVQEVVDWCRTLPELPLGLRWTGDGRLYSPRFYELGLEDPRAFGLGAVVTMGVEPQARWFFELEYSDTVTYDQLVVFFRVLDATLPVGGRFSWLTRSPNQEALAKRMIDERLPYWDRVASYRDLASPGEVEVYGPGVAAGRVVLARAEPSGTTDRDVLVLGRVPDWLPPAAALITSVPQTPLAHVNLLARNRGIPNAYLGLAVDDPFFGQLARARAPVAVLAREPDHLVVRPITGEQYARYLELGRRPSIAVEPVDPDSMPLTMDLTGDLLGRLADLGPVIGGKCSGMVALLAQLSDGPDPVAVPYRPMAITARAYLEHVEPLAGTMAAMLADEEFGDDQRVRALVLEGLDGLARTTPGVDAIAFRAAFLDARGPDDPLAGLVAAGGLVEVIRGMPVPDQTLGPITLALHERYGALSHRQGLRFRSSSNVEDLEGFNGAGLYDSNTGFLYPDERPTARERRRTVAWALKKTWASYWSVEAFEERAREGVEHLSGAMAVLVHPRFDDPLEEANGVFTFTILPWGRGARMELNVQQGPLSVTNPPPGSDALPEVDVVEGHGDGPPEITRVRGSTELPVGVYVLSDGELMALFSAGRGVAEAWLERANEGLPRAMWASSVVLDFEFKRMAEGWPASEQGDPMPGRLVLKQVRSLDPGLARIPERLRSRPFPRDVLARASKLVDHRCAAGSLLFLVEEAFTEPTMEPDMGYSERPFVGGVVVVALADRPDLGLEHGQSLVAVHPWFAGYPIGPDGAVSLGISPEYVDAAGFSSLEISPAGDWILVTPGARASGSGASCQDDLRLSSPGDYLRSLLGE